MLSSRQLFVVERLNSVELLPLIRCEEPDISYIIYQVWRTWAVFAFKTFVSPINLVAIHTPTLFLLLADC